MDDGDPGHQENDYPDPGLPSLNPYPTLDQPTWTTPMVHDQFAQQAQDGDEGEPIIDHDGEALDEHIGYRELAENFHVQHGGPSEQRRGWHFPGELNGGLDDDIQMDDDDDDEGAPMMNPYYDPDLMQRAEAGVVETGDEGSDDEDPSFDAALAEALAGSDPDDSNSDGEALSSRGKSTRGRPLGRHHHFGRDPGRLQRDGGGRVA